MKILIDTNAYSALLKGDRDVLKIISKAEIIYISVFVLSELFYGFKAGSKYEWNIEILSKFIGKQNVKIIHTTHLTAELFADIKLELKSKGNPIPINDIWIAAHSIEYNSLLITYDNHFKLIRNINLWN